ncbi:MAG: MFS transporter [bacterium]
MRRLKLRGSRISASLRSMNFLVAEGFLANIFIIVTGVASVSPYPTAFFLKFNISQIQLGILAAIPPAASFFKLLASHIFERNRKRKEFCITSAILSRLSFLLMVGTSFVLGLRSRSLPIWPLLCLIALSNIFHASSVTSWTSWVADLIPANIRGRYLGKRSSIITIGSILFPFAVGRFLDRYSEVNHYLLLFLAATLLGALGTLFLFPVEDVRMKPSSVGGSLPSQIRVAMENSAFRRLVAFNVFFVFAVGIRASFFNVFLIQDLKLSLSYISLLSISASVISLFFTHFWGAIIDRVGSKVVMTVGVMMASAMTFIWAFTTPSNYNILFLSSFVQGIGWSGIGLASFNLLLDASEREGRSLYEAVYAIFNGVSGVVSPMVGSLIVQLTQSLDFDFLGLRIYNFKLLFIATSLLRFLSLFLLARVPARAPVEMREFLRELVSSNPIRTFASLFLYSQSLTEARRLSAIQSFGRSKSSVVVNELIDALNDPSQRIRKEAALALGRIGDRQAFDALVEKLEDPNSFIQEEAAEALGMLKDSRGVDVLIRNMEGGDSYVKGGIALALGEIGDERGKPAILKLLREERDGYAFVSAAEAASKMKLYEAGEHILRAYREASSTVLRGQLANYLGDLFGEAGEFYRLQSALEREGDYALLRATERLLRRIPRGFAHSAGPRRRNLEGSSSKGFPEDMRSKLRERLDTFLNCYQEGLFSFCLEALSASYWGMAGEAPSSEREYYLRRVLESLLSLDVYADEEDVVLALYLFGVWLGCAISPHREKRREF